MLCGQAFLTNDSLPNHIRCSYVGKELVWFTSPLQYLSIAEENRPIFLNAEANSKSRTMEHYFSKSASHSYVILFSRSGGGLTGTPSLDSQVWGIIQDTQVMFLGTLLDSRVKMTQSDSFLLL